MKVENVKFVHLYWFYTYGGYAISSWPDLAGKSRKGRIRTCASVRVQICTPATTAIVVSSELYHIP